MVTTKKGILALKEEYERNVREIRGYIIEYPNDPRNQCLESEQYAYERIVKDLEELLK
jgi:hypothetical protein